LAALRRSAWCSDSCPATEARNTAQHAARAGGQVKVATLHRFELHAAFVSNIDQPFQVLHAPIQAVYVPHDERGELPGLHVVEHLIEPGAALAAVGTDVVIVVSGDYLPAELVGYADITTWVTWVG
jgi:hypothetical protein